MVAHKSGSAGKEAIGVASLPINSAEDTVQTLEGWSSTLVGPSVTTTMKRKLAELEIIKSTTKTSHDTAGDVRIVLVAGLVDHVEVAHHNPGPIVRSTNITQLVKELNLLVIRMRPIHGGKPPGAGAISEAGSDRESANVMVRSGDVVRFPSKDNTTTGTRGRQVDEIQECITQSLHYNGKGDVRKFSFL
jgi:hypothetical protein